MKGSETSSSSSHLHITSHKHTHTHKHTYQTIDCTPESFAAPVTMHSSYRFSTTQSLHPSPLSTFYSGHATAQSFSSTHSFVVPIACTWSCTRSTVRSVGVSGGPCHAPLSRTAPFRSLLLLLLFFVFVHSNYTCMVVSICLFVISDGEKKNEYNNNKKAPVVF